MSDFVIDGNFIQHTTESDSGNNNFVTTEGTEQLEYPSPDAGSDQHYRMDTVSLEAITETEMDIASEF